MKFKTVCMVLGLALLISGATAAAMTVSVDSASVSAGSKAIIPVKVSGASNLGAMDLVITYDPSVLTFSSADLGGLSTNGMIDSNSATPGTVKIAIVDTKGVSGDGVLVNLAFTVVGKNGEKSPVNVQVTGAWNLNLVDIQTSVSSGTISVGGAKSPLSIVSVIGAICVAVIFLGIQSRRKE
ncbi:MAG: cohesin domain-containing protein [Methanoregula sp.]|nr:cohesin domain-containing protein [Methanoregula sp.]